MTDKIKRYLKKIGLKNRQKRINKKYEKEGLTDEILNEQLEINKLRNELNIPDDNEKVYEDFVQ